jgi:hypothetical protein
MARWPKKREEDEVVVAVVVVPKRSDPTSGKWLGGR